MKLLRIAQFSDSFPPLMDGVGSTVLNYCTHLNAKGHQCRAIVSGSTIEDGYAYDRAHGIDYTIRERSYPLKGIKPYGIIHRSRAFRHQVLSQRYDLLHSHSPFYMGAMSEEVRQAQNIPMIATFHTLFRDDILGLTRSRLITDQVMKKIMKHFQDADEVWTPTEWSRDRLFGYGVDREVAIVANGCDFLIPSDDVYHAYRESGRRFLGFPTDTRILIYVGQIKAEKNLPLIIESLPYAKEAKVPFKMVFVGYGSDQESLTRLAQRHGVADLIHFTGRIVDREVLKSVMAASYLMLFPSQYDTAALVLYEAAAFSLPLLNTAGSATATRSSDGYNGFIAANDARSYGKQVARLLAQPNLVRSVGEMASKTLHRHWSTAVDEVNDRYQQIIERSGRR